MSIKLSLGYRQFPVEISSRRLIAALRQQVLELRQPQRLAPRLRRPHRRTAADRSRLSYSYHNVLTKQSNGGSALAICVSCTDVGSRRQKSRFPSIYRAGL